MPGDRVVQARACRCTSVESSRVLISQRVAFSSPRSFAADFSPERVLLTPENRAVVPTRLPLVRRPCHACASEREAHVPGAGERAFRTARSAGSAARQRLRPDRRAAPGSARAAPQPHHPRRGRRVAARHRRSRSPEPGGARRRSPVRGADPGPAGAADRRRVRSFPGGGRTPDHGRPGRFRGPVERQALRRLLLHAQALPPSDLSDVDRPEGGFRVRAAWPGTPRERRRTARCRPCPRRGTRRRPAGRGARGRTTP